MKAKEIILHIVGLIFIGVSIYAYLIKLANFYEGTLIGCSGIVLILFNATQLRGFAKKLIEKYLKK